MKKRLAELVMSVKRFFAKKRTLLVAGTLGIIAFWSLAGWFAIKYCGFSWTPVSWALGILSALMALVVYFSWPFTEEEPEPGAEEKIAA